MTQEDRELLLKDLCARLPYGVVVRVEGEKYFNETKEPYITSLSLNNYILDYNDVTIIPFLRPMSSMTEEEKQKYYDLTHQEDDDVWAKCLFDKMVDFCNERHLDFRGLIPMGLALEAPENMYKTH